MSQYDILDLLKENTDRWFNATEIERELKININGIRHSLSKLRKNNSVEFMNLKIGHIWSYGYRFKKIVRGIDKKLSGIKSVEVG